MNLSLQYKVYSVKYLIIKVWEILNKILMADTLIDII
jgi:hypothetical protein